jgi:hypothetical protein
MKSRRSRSGSNQPDIDEDSSMAVYYELKQRWHEQWFLTTLEHIKIDVMSWEQIIETIRVNDEDFGVDLAEFYRDCLRFNQIQERETEVR